MYEARFTTKQIYDNYAKSVSKPKNANQQAARTMKAAGIGSLGGKTTTASAKSIQDSFKEKRERRRKNKGSTYDEVPQVLTQGIVQKPKAKPVKEKGYEKVIRVFNNAMERFGIFDEPTSTYDTVKPQNVYKSSLFSVPKVTTITLPDMMPTTSSPYRPLPSGPDTRNFGSNIGADPSPEKPESAKFDIYDMLNTKEKVMRGSVPGLMSPPTMDQTKPETPGLTIEDAVNRAILATTKEYVIKPGDNLTKIAKRYGTTVKDLVQINKIKNKNKIYAGESLRVPKDSVKDIKEAVLRISTSGDEDPDKKFYQSGVPLDQRIFEPETGFEGMGPDPSEGQSIIRGLMSKIDDDMGLPYTRSDTEQIIALEPIFKFIEKGEGKYNSSNRGTLGGKIKGSTNRTTRDGKKLTEMTIAEIKEKQAITDPNNSERLFAVGRFQVIPNTLDMAIEGLGLSDDTVFNEETQNKIGKYLITEKRKKVGKYLQGDNSVSQDEAMLELAKEFASFPVPKDMSFKRGGKTVKLKKGDSYYGSGNKAQHTVEEVEEELDKLRGNM